MRPCEDLWGTCLCAKSGFPIPLPKTSWDKSIFPVTCNAPLMGRETAFRFLLPSGAHCRFGRGHPNERTQ